ncbi:MAG TPA: SMC-Scp complex subunit ScpB, partial [Actinopolymorphaceae bacterium]
MSSTNDAAEPLEPPVEPEASMGAETPAPGALAEEPEASGPPADLRGPIEAILLVTDEPLSSVTLAQVLDRPRAEVEQALRDLAEEYDARVRGFELRAVADGWRLYTREEYADVVEKFVVDGQQAKLTQAALETLAVVAYRQPVSR